MQNLRTGHRLLTEHLQVLVVSPTTSVDLRKYRSIKRIKRVLTLDYVFPPTLFIQGEFLFRRYYLIFITDFSLFKTKEGVEKTPLIRKEK